MSNATAGPGFLLQMGDGGAPENFTTIAEVKDIKGPGGKVNTEDVTNQSSPNNTKEIIATLIEGGECSFDVQFVPGDATHNGSTGLWSKLKNRTLTNFKLLYPGAAHQWAFAGFVTEMGPSHPVNGVLTASVTITISGLPVLT